jgi:hypothetical protein
VCGREKGLPKTVFAKANKEKKRRTKMKTREARTGVKDDGTGT